MQQVRDGHRARNWPTTRFSVPKLREPAQLDSAHRGDFKTVRDSGRGPGVQPPGLWVVATPGGNPAVGRAWRSRPLHAQDWEPA